MLLCNFLQHSLRLQIGQYNLYEGLACLKFSCGHSRLHAIAFFVLVEFDFLNLSVANSVHHMEVFLSKLVAGTLLFSILDRLGHQQLHSHLIFDYAMHFWCKLKWLLVRNLSLVCLLTCCGNGSSVWRGIILLPVTNFVFCLNGAPFSLKDTGQVLGSQFVNWKEVSVYKLKGRTPNIFLETLLFVVGSAENHPNALNLKMRNSIKEVHLKISGIT